MNDKKHKIGPDLCKLFHPLILYLSYAQHFYAVILVLNIGGRSVDVFFFSPFLLKKFNRILLIR